MKPTFKSFRKVISLTLIFAFVGSSLYVPKTQAGEMVMPIMPKPGTMVNLSPVYTPAYLKGIVIHPDNALKFDFLVHKGDGNLDEAQKRQEYNKLIKYFLAALTVPDKDQWVNLSPYEKNRIVENDFGTTEMGRDLLSQDYLLKQITSSLMYPESGLGKVFWDKVYERAYKEFGTTQIPVNTFNKVWIVPDEALIYESGNTAYVVKSHLKVMLEEDYLSLKKHAPSAVIPAKVGIQNDNKAHAVASKVIKEVILPEIEREVNEGKNFAMLRQVFSGMVLATWYKKALKESLLGKVYADKAKVQGVDQNPKNNEAIYHKYLAAFKKGVYNYIKEDTDKYTNEVIPRKYFAGGFIQDIAQISKVEDVSNAAMSATITADADTIDAATVAVDPSQTPLPPDAAMLVDELEPYGDMGIAYKESPGIIKNLVIEIGKPFAKTDVEKTEFALQTGAVSGFMDATRRLYEKMKLTIENYHNHLHHLIVTQGSLMLAVKAGLIKEQRDWVITFMGAFFHDFHLREVWPNGKDKPASPAWVYETAGRPGTDNGGQLPDLLGVNNFTYKNPAIGNARYKQLITNVEKRNFQRLFKQIVRKDLEKVYAEIAAIIYRTDYVSEIPPANNTYKNKAFRVRDIMDGLANEWFNKNLEMTDDMLNELIEKVKTGYDDIIKGVEADNTLDDSTRPTQINWLNRQRDVELNFLEALRNVEVNRRLRVYQIANIVELSDQSASAWIGSYRFSEQTTEGLMRELPPNLVNVETNFPGFYESNLTNQRVLPRLSYLTLNFKANLIGILDRYAKRAMNYAKNVLKSAVSAGISQDRFNQILNSWNRWRVARENIMADWSIFQDSREFKEQQGTYHQALQQLRETILGKSVSLTDLYYMLVNRILIRENSKPGQKIIMQGQNPGLRGRLYFIASGSVNVIRDGHIVATLEPGLRGHFGEMAFLNYTTRNATIEAGEEGAVVYALQAPYMNGLRLDNPYFNELLLASIPGRSRLDFQEGLPALVQSKPIIKIPVVNEEVAILTPHLEPGMVQSEEILAPNQYMDLITSVLEELKARYPDDMSHVKMVAVVTAREKAIPPLSPAVLYEYPKPNERGKILVFSNGLFKPGGTLEDRVRAAADAFFNQAMSTEDVEQVILKYTEIEAARLRQLNIRKGTMTPELLRAITDARNVIKSLSAFAEGVETDVDKTVLERYIEGVPDEGDVRVFRDLIAERFSNEFYGDKQRALKGIARLGPYVEKAHIVETLSDIVRGITVDQDRLAKAISEIESERQKLDEQFRDVESRIASNEEDLKNRKNILAQLVNENPSRRLNREIVTLQREIAGRNVKIDDEKSTAARYRAERDSLSDYLSPLRHQYHGGLKSIRTPLPQRMLVDAAMKGGIDLNAANLDLQIKRDGKGVPLPVSQQDMAQLARISGFVPRILEIKPVSSLPFLSDTK